MKLPALRPAARAPATPSARPWAKRGFEIFLLGLIALGIVCRFVGLSWDEGLQLHPDERFVIDLVGKIGWPSSLALWFDSTRSPFNPANLENAHYVYGQWPLLLGKSAALAMGKTDLGANVPLARALSAVCDSFTVLLTFFVARRVLPRHFALFAAALVALAALHVQQSHFFTVDNFAAFWMLAAFWGAARWRERGRARDALVCGACLGVALACKISAVFIAIPLLALLLSGIGKYPFRRVIVGALGCVLLALLAFRTFQPMAFVGEFGFFDVRPEPRFWNDLAGQAAITNGTADVPFNVQWVGRAPWLFSARNLGFWGYGWGLLFSGALGAIFALWNAFRSSRARDKNQANSDAIASESHKIWARKRDERTPVLLASALFCLLLFGVQGATFSKFTRYFLPMTPFMAILAAYAWQKLAARATGRATWLLAGPPLVAGFTALWCVAVTSIYTRPHTRLEASRWIVANIPPGTRTINETLWDEGLPLGWGPIGRGDLDSQLIDSYNADTVEKREQILRLLDESEWLFLSSGRSWQNIPRWPDKWPMSSRFYYALWNGELGYVRAREFTSYPQLGPLQFPDDDAEEALSVYDHPRVILWKKSPNYSAAKARAILEQAPLAIEREWQPRNAR